MRIIKIALFFCACLGAAYFYQAASYKKTDGFSPEAIRFDIPHEKKWETPSQTREEKIELERILQQPFVYLGKGARSYAFLSEDCEYVLKFFKFRYHTPHWTVRYLPPIPPFNYFREKKIHKVSLDTVLSGYGIAYEEDREGTGLIHIHLNPTEGIYPSVDVTDKAQKTYTIPLDTTRFVLQRKVEVLENTLDKLLSAGNVAAAEKKLSQTLDLYLSHFEKGLFDLGVGIGKNNGFIGEEPVHFDVGKMTRSESIRHPEMQREALEVLISKAEAWIKKEYPQYSQEIAASLREKYIESQP